MRRRQRDLGLQVIDAVVVVAVMDEQPLVSELSSPDKESPATQAGLSVLLFEARTPYIMPSIPPMPPGGIAGPSSFFGFSATVASVVISNPAIDDAF